MIVAKDLQVQNVRSDSNPNNDNKIRKAWVMQMPEEAAAKLKSLPQEARFAVYASIDQEVGTKWVEVMRNYYDRSIKDGANVVVDKRDCLNRLEDSYCTDADEHLITAAQIVVEDFVATAK